MLLLGISIGSVFVTRELGVYDQDALDGVVGFSTLTL